jgi:hypothetical protein
LSGGSFNYLYCKDGYDLLETSTEEDLCSMANTIESYDVDGEEALKHIRLMLNKMTEIRSMIDDLTDLSVKAEGVFKAVEWFESSDTSAESAIKAIREFSINTSSVS